MMVERGYEIEMKMELLYVNIKCHFCVGSIIIHVCYMPLSWRHLLETPMSEWFSQRSVLNSPAQLMKPHAYGFLHGVRPSHIWSSFFPAAFYFPQSYCLSQRILCPHDVLTVGKLQFCHFASRDVLELIYSRTSLVIFLVAGYL